MNTLEAPEVDHYTPLSRAVASIDRDSYAARFAIYDQAHKALLRRLATVAPPPSGEEIEREEQAFRDAVRRVEFSDELAQEEADSPALVPPHEPVGEEALHEPVGEEALQELRRDAPWPVVRPRRDTLDAPDALGLGFERNEPDIALSSLLPMRPPRGVMRRVVERLLLAVFALALGGAWIYVANTRQQAIEPARAAAAPIEVPEPASATTDAKPPGWLSPELFYTAPSFPSAPAPAPAAAAHRP
jgi:hypothetical protein